MPDTPKEAALPKKPVALLSFIRGAETSRGYDDYFRGSVLAPPKPLTQMTVREVQAWQRQSVRAGSKSSAAGGYQIISKTFNGLAKDLGLTGDELFDTDMQDRMGMALLERRGFSKWQAGKMDDQSFMNGLANEWAALPNHSGRSAYHGDGLNAATRSGGDLLAALTATRNGEEIDLSGFSASATRQSPMMAARAGAEAARQARISHVNPSENFTGADMGLVAATPRTSFVSDRERKAAERAAEEAANGPAKDYAGLGEWLRDKDTLPGPVRMAIDEQWIATNVLRQLGQESHAPDPNFRFNDELWKELTGGLPPEYTEVMDEAVSEGHARTLAAMTRQSYERDRKLGSLGVTGIGLQLGASILDPVSILATVATEGTLGPAIYGAKVSRMGRFLRAGAAGAAVNAGLDSYLISQDPVGQWSDLAYSAVGGFVLGGAVGAFKSSPADPEMRKLFKGWIRQADEAETVAAGGVTQGSVGAAKVPGTHLTDAEALAAKFDDTPFSAFGSVRIDRTGMLMQSKSGLTRAVAESLGEDGVGRADGSVSRIAADEKAARDIRTTETRFFKAYNPAFKAWAKENGMRAQSLYDPSVRAKFNWEVGKAVRRPEDAKGNTHVQAVAATVREEFARLHKFGVEHNIPGFKEFGSNDTYLTRQYRIQAMDDLVEKWGRGNVNRLVAESLVSGDRKWRAANTGAATRFEALDLDDAMKLADALIHSVRSRKFGQFAVNRGLSGADNELLEDMLRDAGLASEDVAKITDKMKAKQTEGDASGKLAVARRRINLDETMTVKGYTLDGKAGELSLEDILENDVETLFSHYASSVIRTGHVEDALSQFKMPDAEGNLPAHAPSFEAIKRAIGETSKLSAKEQKAEFDRLDSLYRSVKGIPMEPDKAYHDYLRRLRDFNFIRLMGQLGVAQLAELGAVLGNGGMRAMVQHIPAFRGVIAKAKGGNLPDPFLDELESIFGTGTDVLRGSPAVRMDDATGGSFEGRGLGASSGQTLDYNLAQGKRAVSLLSGMSHINRTLQRLNSRVIVQRMLDNAHGKRRINMRRLRSLGISEEMAERVNKQIRTHMDTADGILGRKAKRINIDAWDDVDAKNAFINGVDRWSRRSIQENNPGNMPAWMTTEMGKTVGQFRSFVIAAYTKQLLNGMHMRDMETFSTWAASMFFGGLFYVGQQQVNAIGRPDAEKWLEKRLSPAEIGKAAFQRAGFSTFLPGIIDTAAIPFVDEPVFAYRNSGLASNVFGNPTMDLLSTAHDALNGAASAAAQSDYDFSQQDWRKLTSLLPLQNAFVIRNGLAAMGGGLPRWSR